MVPPSSLPCRKQSRPRINPKSEHTIMVAPSRRNFSVMRLVLLTASHAFRACVRNEPFLRLITRFSWHALCNSLHSTDAPQLFKGDREMSEDQELSSPVASAPIRRVCQGSVMPIGGA